MWKSFARKMVFGEKYASVGRNTERPINVLSNILCIWLNLVSIDTSNVFTHKGMCPKSTYELRDLFHVADSVEPNLIRFWHLENLNQHVDELSLHSISNSFYPLQILVLQLPHTLYLWHASLSVELKWMPMISKMFTIDFNEQ